MKLYSTTMASNDDLSNLSNFLKVFFDFNFCLGLSPFRFKCSTTTEKVLQSKPNFIVHVWFPQKVFCGLNTLSFLFWTLTTTHVKLPTKHNDPSQFFDLALTIVTVGLHLLTLYTFWSSNGRENLLKIVNFHNSKEFEDAFLRPQSSKHETGASCIGQLFNFLWKKWTNYGLCSLTIIFSLAASGWPGCWSDMKNSVCAEFSLEECASGWQKYLGSILTFFLNLPTFITTICSGGQPVFFCLSGA